MFMNKNIIDIIHKDFKADEVESVISELSSISLKHVMAESEFNLLNTRLAILKLAKGNFKQLVEFTKCAKIDFRDVIMWSMEEQ